MADGAGTSPMRETATAARHVEAETVAMEIAAALHHSLLAQKTASSREQHGVPDGAGAAGGGQSRSVSWLPQCRLLAGVAGEAVDDAALSFLLQQSLAVKKEGGVVRVPLRPQPG